jgi:energy-coupling factor transporter transmembrane protein EcfT
MINIQEIFKKMLNVGGYDMTPAFRIISTIGCGLFFIVGIDPLIIGGIMLVLVGLYYYFFIVKKYDMSRILQAFGLGSISKLLGLFTNKLSNETGQNTKNNDKNNDTNGEKKDNQNLLNEQIREDNELKEQEIQMVDIVDLDEDLPSLKEIPLEIRQITETLVKIAEYEKDESYQKLISDLLKVANDFVKEVVDLYKNTTSENPEYLSHAHQRIKDVERELSLTIQSISYRTEQDDKTDIAEHIIQLENYLEKLNSQIIDTIEIK